MFILDRIKSVYQRLEGIDPFAEGVAEESVPGGVVGPTIACIIRLQFQNIRDGDSDHVVKVLCVLPDEDGDGRSETIENIPLFLSKNI